MGVSSLEPPPGLMDGPLPGEEAQYGVAVVNHAPAPAQMQVGSGMTMSQGETASSSLAATARALVEARYVVAQYRPRNWLTVQARLMESCRRPGFAARAEYKLPRWDARTQKEVHISGPTIRFAEEAMRCAGNIDIRVDVVFENDDQRVVSIGVCDLETNTSYQRPAVIKKQMMRSSLKKGQTAIRKELNSMGQAVFIVAITEDELLQKQNAAISRVIRTDGLRLIPMDVKEDALMLCAETRGNEAASDPAAFAKRLAFSFYKIGVEADALEKYLGKRLTAVKKDDVDRLQSIFNAISEGETTWEAVTAAETGETGKPSTEGTGEEGAPSAAKGTAGLRERLKKDAPKPPTREPGEEG